MDVRALRYFVEVVRQRGFTRASATLHVTQSAVSKTVAALEDEVGAPLLVRERRDVLLTDAGRIVLERARSILDSVDALQAELAELGAVRRGRVRIGLPHMVGAAFFPPVLSEFRRTYPGVAVELREAGARHLEALVRERELDVSVTVLPTDASAFETLPFVEDALLAVLHPDHALARRREVALRDLAATPFVFYRPDFVLHGHVLDACRSAGFTPEIATESAEWDFLAAMAAAAVGVALLPGTICRRLARDDVVTVRLVDPVIPWNLALVWRRDRQLTPASRAFLDLARQRLRAAPARRATAGPRTPG